MFFTSVHFHLSHQWLASQLKAVSDQLNRLTQVPQTKPKKKDKLKKKEKRSKEKETTKLKQKSPKCKSVKKTANTKSSTV